MVEKSSRKEWYIKTPEKEDSSREAMELYAIVKIVSIAPDTLVRKGNEKNWSAAYRHPELKAYCKRKKAQEIAEPEDLSNQKNGRCSQKRGMQAVTCTEESLPVNFDKNILWLLLLLLFLFTIKSLGKR